MMTVEDVVTPFDELDGPTTVATPTCCCCCCCCVAAMVTASVVSGRLVHRDLHERDRDASGVRALLVVAAVLVPISWLVVLYLVASVTGDLGALFVFVASFAIVGLLLGLLRKLAGAPRPVWMGTAIVFPCAYFGAIVADLALFLSTIGVFWLTIPLWVVVAVKSTGKPVPLRPTGLAPPLPPPSWVPPTDRHGQ